MCLKCLYKCQACVDGISCTKCAPNSFRDPAPNCLCKEEYFDNGVPICVPCTFYCQTCLKKVEC
jgi:hypothetical protein